MVGAALACIGAVIGVREVMKPPAAPPAASGGSMTDLAPTATVTVTVGGPVAPNAADATPTPVPTTAVVAPSAMADPANPPRWTEPLAMPGVPAPPDPFNPPPLAVDPSRGRNEPTPK